MDITGIAKSHQAGIPKASSRKEWKLSDSLREQIAGYAREDAAQGIYMGNKFLALRKSEVAKVAPDRAGIPGFRQIGESGNSVCRECRNKLLKLGGIMNNTVLEFECIGMDDGSKFPIEYTGRGQDISPEFIIKNLSPNAKTLAVTLEDLSHPIKEFTHWVIWNIPATDRIKKNIPAGKAVPILGNARQGIGYGLHRYAGPKPPKGKKHTYRFTVYSLDCEINMSANSMKRNFLKKAERHIIQKGSIVGEFE